MKAGLCSSGLYSSQQKDIYYMYSCRWLNARFLYVWIYILLVQRLLMLWMVWKESMHSYRVKELKQYFNTTSTSCVIVRRLVHMCLSTIGQSATTADQIDFPVVCEIGKIISDGNPRLVLELNNEIALNWNQKLWTEKRLVLTAGYSWISWT